MAQRWAARREDKTWARERGRERERWAREDEARTFEHRWEAHAAHRHGRLLTVSRGKVTSESAGLAMTGRPRA